MKSVIAEEFKYIRAGEDEELYNIRQDPCELRNLAGRKNLQTKMNWFRGMFADGLP